jgi:sulfide:quinone oxidoreductase
MLQRVVRSGRHGLHTRLAFVVPAGPVWPLPAYELALQTDRLLRRRGVRDRVSLMLVTAEDAPLALFGPVTSDAVAEDLVLAGIALRAGVVVRAWSWGRLELASRQHVAVDRVVALPRQRGPAIPGLPRDEQGFVRAGVDGRVAGRPDVFVVGDAGAFAVKQGGIACQQADAAAAHIAATAGAPVEPRPFVPELKGLLLTEHWARYLKPGAGASILATRGLSWPPSKIAGRELSAYLKTLEPVSLR